MAKKTQKNAAHAKHEAAPAKKEEGSSIGWIIAAIVVIVIIAFLVMKPSTQAPTQNNNAQQAPTQVNGVQSASAPTNLINNCTATIGIIPGSFSLANNIVTVTFRNNGRVQIDGTYLQFRGVDQTKVIYEQDNSVIAVGQTANYTVDLNALGTTLGAAVNSFVLYPIQAGNTCFNQKVVVIKDRA